MDSPCSNFLEFLFNYILQMFKNSIVFIWSQLDGGKVEQDFVYLT